MSFEDMCDRITEFLNGPPLKSERVHSEPGTEDQLANAYDDLGDSLRAIAAELGRPSVKVYAIAVPGRFSEMQFDYPMHVRRRYPGEIVARLARCGFTLYPRHRGDRARAAKRARHAARPNGRGKGR